MLDWQSKLFSYTFEVCFLFNGLLVDLECGLNLLGSKSFSQSILANDPYAFLSGWLVITHLLGKFSIFLYFLLSVPEPLVHLILFQAKFI